MQHRAVVIELRLTDENLKVSGHMENHEADADQAGDSHDDLLPDRRSVEGDW
jgi:hypothetical protein